MKIENMKPDHSNKVKNPITRRDLLAGLASLPFLGLLGYGLFRNKAETARQNSSLLSDIDVVIPKGIPPLIDGPPIRIGIVGCGGRGRYLMKSLGFLHPGRIDEYKENARKDKFRKEYLEQFMTQENLNVKITAICDVFDKHAERAVETGANFFRNGKGG